MFKHFKRSWGIYVAIVVVASSIVALSAWIYQNVLHRFGQGPAFVVLIISIFAIIFFAILGALIASRFENLLRGQIMTQMNRLQLGTIPSLSRALGLAVFRQPETSFEFSLDPHAENGAAHPLGAESPRRSRGRKSRFSEERMRETVLKWGKLGDNVSAITLPDFLADEFGTDPDGTLTVPPGTFYAWNTRIQGEDKAEQENQESS